MESFLVLSELLSTERIRVPLGSHSQADLLRELVELAVGEDGVAVVGAVLAAVQAREAEAGTAMGGGLALPHGRTDLVHEVRLAGGLVSGVPDYHASDGSAVQVAFLVLSPFAAGGEHVRLLARIARLMRLMHKPAWRAALLASRTAQEFLGVVRQADAVPVS